MITFIILRREINNNEQFVHGSRHKIFCTFIAFCSLGVISLFADIARFISLIYVNSVLYFYAIPMICFFLTSLVLTFGLFYRFYESMIRGL
ncbi:unnamed protein product [Rhizophagus irregularis]|nr:unnamed protein product [Rhizophagus irregularis]